jgi:hypothetical protein
MSERKNDRRGDVAAGTAAEELALRRMEALEPWEGAMGVPVEREVVFIRVGEWSIMYRRGELPKVCRHEDGRIVCIHGREIPDELAEEYLRQHPGAKFK